MRQMLTAAVVAILWGPVYANDPPPTLPPTTPLTYPRYSAKIEFINSMTYWCDLEIDNCLNGVAPLRKLPTRYARRAVLAEARIESWLFNSTVLFDAMCPVQPK
jgi:hypothetical protein